MSLYQLIKDKWKARILGNVDTADDTLPLRALAYAKSIRKESPDGHGKDLWPDLLLTERSSHITAAFCRIRDMALAYQSSFFPETYGNPELFKAALTGLERMRFYYRKDMELFDNWWDYDIGGAQALMDSLVLFCGELKGKKVVSHYMEALHAFIPVPESVRRPDSDNLQMTGANLADTALVCLLRALIGENQKGLMQVQAAMAALFLPVTQGDGFYQDGSFIQHHHIPYAGGYGPDLLSSFENIVYLLMDTPYSLTALKDFSSVSGWILDSFLPLMRDGEMMDMVRGRKTSRYQECAHDTGRIVMSTLLLLAGYLSPEKNRSIRKIIKGQIERNTYGKERLYEGLRPWQKEALRDLLSGPLEPAKQTEEYRTYGSMDRVVVHRTKYSLGISMFSERTGRFSFGNGENKKGFHACEGMLYLYTDDRSHYDDGYWPAADMMRLSGITTGHTKTELVPWEDNRNSRIWAGGSSLLNRYGSTGMELELPESDLTARKSWFVFEEGIICLGAGITASIGDYVETIAENRRVVAERVFVDGEKIFLTNGMKHQIKVRSITLESKFLPISYYFPEKQEITLKKEIREGCFRDLNDNGTTDRIRRSFLTIAFTHGKMPEKETYSYVLVPGAGASEIKSLLTQPMWEIAENTEKIQAAIERKTGLMGINYWEPGSICKIQADNPCSVTVKREGGKRYLGIADPTQHQANVTVILEGSYRKLSGDKTIELFQEEGRTRLVISTEGSGGKTHSIIVIS